MLYCLCTLLYIDEPQRCEVLLQCVGLIIDVVIFGDICIYIAIEGKYRPNIIQHL